MNAQSVARQLTEMADRLASSLDLKLWGIEYLPGARRTILRIFIEADGRNIDVEDCARFSRTLGVALDVEDIIPGAYTLEVSSPGLERRFFSPAQMSDYKGQEVEITLRSALAGMDGQKKFQGVLKNVQDQEISIQPGNEEMRFSWDEIKKARLLMKW